MSKKFILLLTVITVIGFILRLVDYDRIPPYGDTYDEFLYAWQGMTLLQGKPPLGWSNLNAFPEKHNIKYWGNAFPFVSPWLEKPPFYSWIVGGYLLFNGYNNITDVRLSVIRQIPVFLSIITILLIGAVTGILFSPAAGLLAALLYATVPLVVITNRLSLTENFLIPLGLFSLLVFLYKPRSTSESILQTVVLGVCGGVAILTKQIGITIVLTIIILLASQKRWKSILLVGLISGLIGSIYLLLGYIYGWEQFLASQTELKLIHAQGLPEFIFSIFRYPVISEKHTVFLDGSILLGYLLFFTSPWWAISHDNNIFNKGKIMTIFAFPLIYLLVFSLINSGNYLFFYGWYLYPLYPFLIIALALALIKAWENQNFLQMLMLQVFLGSSTLRLALFLAPANLHHLWQSISVIMLFAIIAPWLMPKDLFKLRRFSFLLLIGFVVIVNILSVIYHSPVFSANPQPLI